LASRPACACVAAGTTQGADTFAEECKTPIHIQVSHASKTAQEAVERAGGKVELVYFNRRGLRAHLKPWKFEGNLP
jgi:hypothetical protein